MNPRIPCDPGDEHGQLTVLKTYIEGGIQRALCRCECGDTSTVTVSNLVRGNTKSCGCKRGVNGLVSFDVIAKELGVTRTAAIYHYKNAIEKLKRGLGPLGATPDQIVTALVASGFFDESEAA